MIDIFYRTQYPIRAFQVIQAVYDSPTLWPEWLRVHYGKDKSIWCDEKGILHIFTEYSGSEGDKLAPGDWIVDPDPNYYDCFRIYEDADFHREFIPADQFAAWIIAREKTSSANIEREAKLALEAVKNAEREFHHAQERLAKAYAQLNRVGGTIAAPKEAEAEMEKTDD